MWPEPAGEFGALELGELLWEELPPGSLKKKERKNKILIIKHIA